MNDNSALYDLIANIQTKLNNENENSSDTSSNNTYTNETNKDTTNNNSNSNFSNIDMETILKMQNLISKFNQNSPRKNLLYSLKPFLNEKRQDKLGEYITILSIMDALNIFGKKGSDN